MIDTKKRTLTKTISWRVVAMLTTMAVVYALTRKVSLMIGIALLNGVAKMIFYYIHERVWDKITWGRKKHPLEGLAVNKELEPEDMERVKEQLKSLGYME